MELQKQLADWDNLRLAYQNAARGKRGTAPVAAFEPFMADHLIELEEELSEQSYHPGAYQSFYIHEPKKRLISAAPFRDRVVHHALCNLTVPYFERLFIANSFANRVGKGTHRAIDCCQQFARRFKYVLQCDVKQFFPSIDHSILRSTLQRMLPDESVMWLIDCILESGQGVLAEEYDMVYFSGDDLLAANRSRGLPIGNLTSQWWGNCFLNPFDHFVRRELGCRAYLRYVDDMALFSNDIRQLWEWRAEIIKRLEKLRLTIHVENSHPMPVLEGIPFLGFVVFPEHRQLKVRKGFAYRRKLKYLIETAPEQVKDSLQGWLNHIRYADTFGLSCALLSEFDLLAQDFCHA